MISLILLVAFIKVSLHYNNPIILAVIYTVATTVVSAMFGVEITVLFISATITFGMMWLFFWLLDRYEDSHLWWAIAIIFPVLMFVLSSAQ
jgi:hypothetical protein